MSQVLPVCWANQSSTWTHKISGGKPQQQQSLTKIILF